MHAWCLDNGSQVRTCHNLTICFVQFLAMLAHSSEFENVAVREEELPELDELALHQCPFDVKGGPENKHGKVNILLQVGTLSPAQCCRDRLSSQAHDALDSWGHCKRETTAKADHLAQHIAML